MQYNGPMSDTQNSSNQCNADRNQRKYCVYFHAKTGICTKPADGGAWQARSGESPPVETK